MEPDRNRGVSQEGPAMMWGGLDQTVSGGSQILLRKKNAVN